MSEVKSFDGRDERQLGWTTGSGNIMSAEEFLLQRRRDKGLTVPVSAHRSYSSPYLNSVSHMVTARPPDRK